MKLLTFSTGRCLNPCCNGMTIEFKEKYLNAAQNVLILVVME